MTKTGYVKSGPPLRPPAEGVAKGTRTAQELPGPPGRAPPAQSQALLRVRRAGHRRRSRRRAFVSGVSVARGGEHLKLGHRYKMTISLGHQEVTRTVQLQKNTRESAVKKQLGY